MTMRILNDILDLVKSEKKRDHQDLFTNDLKERCSKVKEKCTVKDRDGRRERERERERVNFWDPEV